MSQPEAVAVTGLVIGVVAWAVQAVDEWLRS